MGEPPYKGNPPKSPSSVTGDTPRYGLASHLLIALGAGWVGGGDLLLRLPLEAGNRRLLHRRRCLGR